MDGTVPQTGFLPGRNRQNAEKQLSGRESASGLAEKRSFFANLPANRVSAAVAATWRPSAAASFYTSWHRPCGASRGYFAQKRPSERAKSCVFSTIICKGGFPFLRYVSAGAAATFFAAFVPWPVFCFAKLHCIALPPPAFPRSVSILSCPSVLCLRTSDLSGLECFLLRSEQLV